ncbi:ETX/MTX2 family pore-forming toxin [Lactococcus sp. S64]|uniref:ETX/MTX2 family pore-forming toxin n=1 Tax=Lactococcus sp. S64 TaxID=2767459 RepID=UPI0019067CF3|nr:ETX/MTX2 family pore-forming toxin [Lactococcus sp. S64]MBK0084557.1 ETX/MTX2 family pore-forming toxin [Lactococcus sp. S64]
MVYSCLALSLILLESENFRIAQADTKIGDKSTIKIETDRPTVQNNRERIDPDTKKLMEEAQELSKAWSYNMFSAGEFSLDQTTFQNPNQAEPVDFKDQPLVRINDDMRLRDGVALAANKSVLSNSTSDLQVMKTPSFRYESKDEVTTTTSHSTGSSITTSAKMTFPLLSGSMSMEVRYDFSHTNAETTSTTKEWNVPPQDINVPAGKTYQVEWLLKTGVATGTSDLTSKITGLIPYRYFSSTNQRYALNYENAASDFWTNYQKKPKDWADGKNYQAVFGSNGNYVLRKWGVSNYEATYGTEFIMNIIDVTNINDTSPVGTIPISNATVITK